MKSSGEDATIGGLAAHFGLAPHVLRHWEGMGLLAPARAGNGRRCYRSTDYYRVAAILRAKEAGLALDDIHAMITAGDPGDRAATLRRQRDHLAQRITDTRRQLELVEAALRCEHRDIATCPAFRALLADRARLPPRDRRRPG